VVGESEKVRRCITLRGAVRHIGIAEAGGCTEEAGGSEQEESAISKQETAKDRVSTSVPLVDHHQGRVRHTTWLLSGTVSAPRATKLNPARLSY
jgi:hypothetical protein